MTWKVIEGNSVKSTPAVITQCSLYDLENALAFFRVIVFVYLFSLPWMV